MTYEEKVLYIVYIGDTGQADILEDAHLFLFISNIIFPVENEPSVNPLLPTNCLTTIYSVIHSNIRQII